MKIMIQFWKPQLRLVSNPIIAHESSDAEIEFMSMILISVPFSTAITMTETVQSEFPVQCGMNKFSMNLNA